RITSAVAQGQSFEAAAAEAGHKVLSVTNFSRDSFSIPEVGSSLIVSEMLRVAEDLEPGQTSDFIPAGDGGFVLHLTRREPPPESLVSAELPDYSRQARHFGRFAAFSEWERHRFAKANVQVPSSRQSQD